MRSTLYRLAAPLQNATKPAAPQTQQPQQQKVVLPLPPPAAQAQPQQQPQQNQQVSAVEKQITQYLTQNKNKLPSTVRSALTNPQQRQILVAFMDSLSDPTNAQFVRGFMSFVKQMTGQNQKQQQTNTEWPAT
jgi:hypothetical protein